MCSFGKERNVCHFACSHDPTYIPRREESRSVKSLPQAAVRAGTDEPTKSQIFTYKPNFASFARNTNARATRKTRQTRDLGLDLKPATLAQTKAMLF